MADRHDHREILCREFVELVTEYLEGALPAERVELVEQHLVMCDWCKTYLVQLEATVHALPGAAETEPVPAETELALLAAYREWKASP
jgi:anti-sigma factor RsiW